MMKIKIASIVKETKLKEDQLIKLKGLHAVLFSDLEFVISIQGVYSYRAIEDHIEKSNSLNLQKNVPIQ